MTNGLDPVLNFEVTPSWDKRVLVVTDISDWKHLIDEPSYIEITLPGSKTAVRHSYSKNKVMVFIIFVLCFSLMFMDISKILKD